jgi:ATP-binding cassette subfamily A (ABC1) protein 3
MFIVEIIFYNFLSLLIRAYQNSGLNFIYFLKSIFVKVNRETGIRIGANDIKEIPQAIYHEELNEKNKSLKNENTYLNIRNVTRKYDDLIAVNNFNGELFKNEIFCLLGHNGAGKTTLIKMISGAEDPDSGDIFLNNISVVTNKKYLFQNIGLCQQDDIFFEYLTVFEHLKYMMEIKGIKSDIQQINTLITKIGLVQKKDAICKTLSGGEKRKLCVALALIGNSELVLLDEPTSGMDIISKRALWDFLKEFKSDKIIILTTHSLDEAEYLGDRIGIMTNGRYICSGTSSFLKSKYPCGFNLNLLIDSEKCNDSIKQKLYNELIQYEPKLEIKISSKGLFSLNIQSNNQNIKQIFDVITKNKEEYGIEDYTVSSTSLEDVFLKLNHKITINEEEEKTNEEDNLIKINNLDNEPNIKQSFFIQLGSHIKRGYFSLWRNKGLSFLELLMGLLKKP